MVVGTRRETEATMIREDMMLVRILLNLRHSTPTLANNTLLPRTYKEFNKVHFDIIEGLIYQKRVK